MDCYPNSQNQIKTQELYCLAWGGGYLGSYDTGSWFDYPYLTQHAPINPPAENERADGDKKAPIKHILRSSVKFVSTGGHKAKF